MSDNYIKIKFTTLKRREMLAKEWPLILFSYHLYALSMFLKQSKICPHLK
jgi:hypothetical protein